MSMNDETVSLIHKSKGEDLEKLKKKNKKLKKKNQALSELCERSLNLLDQLNFELQCNASRKEAKLTINTRDKHSKLYLGCSYDEKKGFDFGLHGSSDVSEIEIERG